jgi:ferredoxin-NADP reductase
VKSFVRELGNTVFYACGPNALVEFAESLVFELGAAKEQMKTEKWG